MNNSSKLPFIVKKNDEILIFLSFCVCLGETAHSMECESMLFDKNHIPCL